jgi:hypothetical protein
MHSASVSSLQLLPPPTSSLGISASEVADLPPLAPMRAQFCGFGRAGAPSLKLWNFLAKQLMANVPATV